MSKWVDEATTQPSPMVLFSSPSRTFGMGTQGETLLRLVLN
jgi:hypothetical protein